MLWTSTFTLSDLQAMHKQTAIEHLGIEFTEIGDASLSARMPVDRRTVQPFGLLHGGASVLLAETLGSCAAIMCINLSTHYCVGLDISANHIRSAREGFVFGTATPIHVGRSTHVWAIDVKDKEQRPISVSRITMSIFER